MPKSAAPSNLRNGLKWRDGRPRWEPSPASRAIGISGRDLKGEGGAWLERGEAIGAADARQLWAQLVRAATADGPDRAEARADVRKALAQLKPTADAAARTRRALLQDLLDLAAAAINSPEAAPIAGPAPRTVRALVDAWFAAPLDTRGNPTTSTLSAYRVQSKKLVARFGDWSVGRVTPGHMRDWYLELCRDHSLATAAQAIGAAGAFFKWARWEGWIEGDSPVARLGVVSPEGRRVFWTFEEERAFVAFCDAHDFADVADGVTLALWTGARPIDCCAADVSELQSRTWRYTPVKTRKKRIEALPGILPPVQARVARVAGLAVRRFDKAFLFDPHTGRRHNTGSLGKRFRLARAEAVAAGAVPAGFAHKRLQDTRDTCVTRLFEAEGVELKQIPPWTGHSQDDAESILRGHYIVLREEGAWATAEHLAAYAAKQGFALNL